VRGACTNRRGIPPAIATPQNSKADHLVRWHATDSSQATAIGISRCQGLLRHLSALSGAWESDGHFLENSPYEDILDIIDDLPIEIEAIAFGRRFRYWLCHLTSSLARVSYFAGSNLYHRRKRGMVRWQSAKLDIRSVVLMA
jgi:hypothetical protein